MTHKKSKNGEVNRRSLLRAGGMATGLAFSSLARPNLLRACSPAAQTLIRGGWLLSGADDKEGRPADLLVADGRITQIAPAIPRPADAEIIDATDMIVMPGFVDSHRHLWEGVIRAMLPNVDLLGYLAAVNGRFGPAFSPEDAYLGTLIGALEAIDAGITTVFDWSHIQLSAEHSDATIAALRRSGIRGVLGYGSPPGPHTARTEWPKGLLRIRKQYFGRSDDLLTLALAIPGPEFVSDSLTHEHFALAREAKALITMHAAMKGLGKPSAIERYAREGMLGPDVNLVHCNALTAEGWKAVAQSGASISITPSSEMQMGHGIPAIQPAIDCGILPGLGVDVVTSVAGDMWTQMRLAFALQREQAFAAARSGFAVRPLEMNEVFQFATIGGARAAKLQDHIAVLEVGRAADIVLLNADTLNAIPAGATLSSVFVSMDARNIDTVMIAGRVLKRKGKMVNVDVGELRARLVSSRKRVLEAAGNS